MIKKVSLNVIFFALFSLVVYCLHTIGLVNVAKHTPISLIKVYIFHTSFSIVFCVSILFVSYSLKFKDQLGFLYLASVVLKIILFFLIFFKPIFKSEPFTNIESINLLIPIGLFLIFEVFFIVRLLNNIHPLKNDK